VEPHYDRCESPVRIRFRFIDADGAAREQRSGSVDSTSSTTAADLALARMSEHENVASDAEIRRRGSQARSGLQRHAAATNGDTLQIISASGGTETDIVSENGGEEVLIVKYLEAWAGEGEGELRAPAFPGLYTVQYHSAVCGGSTIGQVTFRAQLRQQPVPPAEGGWVRAFVVHDAGAFADEARPPLPPPPFRPLHCSAFPYRTISGFYPLAHFLLNLGFSPYSYFTMVHHSNSVIPLVPDIMSFSCFPVQIRITRRLSAGLDRLCEELGLRFALSSPSIAAAAGEEDAVLSEALYSVGRSHYIAAFLSRTYSSGSAGATQPGKKAMPGGQPQATAASPTLTTEISGGGSFLKRGSQAGDVNSSIGMSSKAAVSPEASLESRRRTLGAGSTGAVAAAVTTATSAVAVRRSALSGCCSGDSGAADLRILAAAGTMRRVEEGQALIRCVDWIHDRKG
jgi:hypothetical protein